MCLPSPCENEGVCTESSTALEGYSCQCRDSWAGRTCTGKLFYIDFLKEFCFVSLFLEKLIVFQ